MEGDTDRQSGESRECQDCAPSRQWQTPILCEMCRASKGHPWFLRRKRRQHDQEDHRSEGDREHHRGL